jgi:molybdate transport system substrate-binding protein
VSFAVPVERGPRITYPVAILKESKNKVIAGDFLNFVVSSSGKQTFQKYGFIVLQ